MNAIQANRSVSITHTMFFGFVMGTRANGVSSVTTCAENFAHETKCKLSPETLVRQYYETLSSYRKEGV